MLEPLSRRQLLEALRPPPGYDVDTAVGTTFSLDLMTLLTVPLAFALSEGEDDRGRPVPDPLALLEAVRRYAGRTHVFCQAGGICLPRGNKLLLGHLERSVHEVVAPKPGGIFHPKVWVLRFSSEGDGPTIYRVLVSSRNLTFDRSWDTLLALEGELRDRARAIRQSVPLADFVGALPGMRLRQPGGKDMLSAVGRVAEELRRVEFETPNGFENLRFHPIGISGAEDRPFDKGIWRMLTVSPFLDPGMLHDLPGVEGGNILVSRLDQLCQMPSESLRRFKEVYFLAPEADADGEADDEDAETPPAETLSGLHAKLYVADVGWKGKVWTGSANATTAAMRRNVEFLVELVGKRKDCGVDAMMERAKTKAQPRFADLLGLYVPDGSEIPPDAGAMELDAVKSRLRQALAVAGFRGAVAQTDDLGRFDMVLKLVGTPVLPDVTDVRLTAWPVTLNENAARQMALRAGSETEFAGVSFEALSAFFAFDVQARKGKDALKDRFVLNVPLSGLPADRQERVLRALLSNRSRVLQFLLFLLAENGDTCALAGMRPETPGDDGGSEAILSSSADLFEAMTATLHRDPARLDRVAGIVADLNRGDNCRELLPDGFMEIWEPIWAARQEMRT